MQSIQNLGSSSMVAFAVRSDPSSGNTTTSCGLRLSMGRCTRHGNSSSVAATAFLVVVRVW